MTHENLFTLNRRSFLSAAAASTAAAAISPLASAAKEKTQQPIKNKIGAFIKFVQSLSYDQLAEKLAEFGFDGIEATIRNRGYILPEKVEDELPKLVEALKKHGLEITVMASDVNRADHPLTEKVLRTAASLGVKRYRMGYYRYDLNRSVAEQIQELKPVVQDLVAMNRDLGISAVYQNHSGAYAVGATIWDLVELFKNYSTDEIGVAFDIRHATVESGLSWPVLFNLVQPHLGAVYVKDFVWDGPKPKNTPLGQGRIDKRFFEIMKKSKFGGPISLHVEYLPKAGLEKNLKALKTDLDTLRGYLA